MPMIKMQRMVPTEITARPPRPRALTERKPKHSIMVSSNIRRGDTWRQIKALYRTLKIKDKRVKFPKGSLEDYTKELKRLRRIETKELHKKKITKRVPTVIYSFPKTVGISRRNPRLKAFDAAKKAARQSGVRLSKAFKDRGTTASFWESEINRIERVVEERGALEAEEARIEPHTIKYIFTGVTTYTDPLTNDEVKDYNDPSIVKRKIRESGVSNNVRVLLYNDEDAFIKEEIYPVTRGKDYRKNVHNDWTMSIDGGSAGELNPLMFSEDYTLIIQPASTLTDTRIAQRFLDSLANYRDNSANIDHCVFTPVLKYAEKNLEEAQKKANKKSKKGKAIIPKRTRQRYKRIIRICKKNMKDFKNGATEEQIQKFCNDVGVNYIIDDIFTLDNKGTNFLTINSTKQSRLTFKFINTRMNHLELSNVVWKSYKDAIIINSAEEMNNIYLRLKSNDITPIYSKNNNEFLWISTINENYQLHTITDEVYSKFYEQLLEIDGIDRRQLDIRFDEKNSRLVRAACHQLGQWKFNNFNANVMKYKRLDMICSYTQFKECSYYQEFPMAFTEFRHVVLESAESDLGCALQNRKFLMDHLGIFCCKNIDLTHMTDKNLKKIFIKTKWFKKVECFPSPYFILMIDLGITFDIDYGCWSCKSFDFEFPEIMYERDPNTNVKWYSKITGSWGALRESNSIHIDGSKEWASHLQSLGYNAIHYPAVVNTPESIRVQFKKEPRQIKHQNHMAAFVTSYQIINMIQQLKEIKYDDLYGILTDEFVVKKDAIIKVHPIFKEKNSHKLVVFGNLTTSILSRYYNSETINNIIKPTINARKFKFKLKNIPNTNRLLHIGQGGSGKTHNILTDEGYLRLLYTAPSHKLRQNKQNEFPQVKTEVHHNILNYPRLSDYQYGLDRKNIFSPSVIVWDESTSATELDNAKLSKLYPHALVIYCGDHDKEKGFSYQMPCIGDMEELNILEFPTIEHLENRRAKCSRLKAFLVKLRSFMKEHYDRSEWKYKVNKLRELILEELSDRVIEKKDVPENYNIDDYVLVGTRTSIKKDKKKGIKKRKSGVDYWNKKLKNKGLKYLVTKNRKGKNPMYSGTVLKPSLPIERANVELRHAFTIHQIQGETVRKKIFIDFGTLFDVVRMFHTAISRAEYMDQIYVIMPALIPIEDAEIDYNSCKLDSEERMLLGIV